MNHQGQIQILFACKLWTGKNSSLVIRLQGDVSIMVTEIGVHLFNWKLPLSKPNSYFSKRGFEFMVK